MGQTFNLGELEAVEASLLFTPTKHAAALFNPTPSLMGSAEWAGRFRIEGEVIPGERGEKDGMLTWDFGFRPARFITSRQDWPANVDEDDIRERFGAVGIELVVVP